MPVKTISCKGLDFIKTLSRVDFISVRNDVAGNRRPLPFSMNNDLLIFL